MFYSWIMAAIGFLAGAFAGLSTSLVACLLFGAALSYLTGPHNPGSDPFGTVGMLWGLVIGPVSCLAGGLWLSWQMVRSK